MRYALIAAVLFAAPALAQSAFAQSQNPSGPSTDGQYRAPNLTNPQHRADEQMNPPEAHQDLSSGDAHSIPTPTLGRATTPITQSPLPGTR